MILSRRLLPLAAVVLTSLSAGAAMAGSSLYRISVNGMVCSFCAQGIEKRLKAMPGAETVHIDLSKGLVEITARQGASIDTATLRKAIRDAGYDVRRIDGPATPAPGAPGKAN